jgi:putative transposase
VRRACRCPCIPRRKRAAVSSVPRVSVDAPKVVWALDFQFDSTIDGKAVKIASMIDEHTRESLLHLVERSISAQRLVIELEDVFDRVGGPSMVLRMDNGPELISQALQWFCDGRVGLCYTPDNRGTTVTSNRSTTAYAMNSSSLHS